ncbi:gamma-tubulin complex component protein [Terfezia claveryi]|nr:gamma-tubulin complex component protein [Terfezia claveryi]
MLHELFIVLSGHPSPIFAPHLPATFPLVSPSERELLNSLSALGNSHISLRQQCAQIASSHPSTIAKALASAIDAYHLQKFRDQVVKVEASVLKRESGVVGGYDIVALSSVKKEFDGWDRILQYLEGLTSLMLSGLSVVNGVVAKDGEWIKGAQLINRLRKDIHTGYPTLEQVSLHLLGVAETAWLRQLSTWVLYGRLPNLGGEDFFVAEKEGDGERVGDSDVMLKDFKAEKKLLPEFVTDEIASSILFIGRSLSHVRIRGGASSYAPAAKGKYSTAATLSGSSPELGLLPTNLAFLQTLRSPLVPQKFSSAIASIRLSLSQHTLHTLLPPQKIVDVLYVFREFFLLGRGEFAITVVAQADESVRNRFRGKNTALLSNSILKEGEVAAVLTRTYGILSSFQNEEIHDERLDLARDYVYLSLQKPKSDIPFPSAKKPSKDPTFFSDLLLGAPVCLNYQILWPMELFLTQSDVDKYDRIFGYLVASRKCLIKLQELWYKRRKKSALLGLVNDRTASNKRRDALNRRAQKERFIWATAGLVVFFLETLGAYWQGEVIEPSFNRLIGILGGLRGQRKNNSRKRKRSDSMATARDGFSDDSGLSSSEGEVDAEGDIDMASIAASEATATTKPARIKGISEFQQDPESLSKAHRLFLNFLLQALFLSDPTFPNTYRQLLEISQNLSAWIARLEPLHNLVDLGVDKPKDTGASEVSDQMAELEEGCRQARRLLGRLVERLHEVDENRGKGAGALVGLIMHGEEDDGSGGGGKVDRLLMRLNWDSMGGGEA